MRGLGQDHPFAVKARLLLVDQAVVGGKLVMRNALTGVQNGIEGLSIVIGMTFALAQVFDLQPAVEQMVDDGTQGHSTSKIPAAPMPPPMHMVTATRLAPRRLPSIRAWPVRR